MKKSFLIFLFSLSIFLFFSCNTKKEEVIVFDSTYPLALAPDVNWAVITEPYVAFRTEMNWNAEVSAYCRKGEILQVIGSSVDKDNLSWYKFDKGWIPSTSLSIYSNRLKAQKTVDSFKD